MIQGLDKVVAIFLTFLLLIFLETALPKHHN